MAIVEGHRVMRVMVLAKAAPDCEAGRLPSAELPFGSD